MHTQLDPYIPRSGSPRTKKRNPTSIGTGRGCLQNRGRYDSILLSYLQRLTLLQSFATKAKDTHAKSKVRPSVRSVVCTACVRHRPILGPEVGIPQESRKRKEQRCRVDVLLVHVYTSVDPNKLLLTAIGVRCPGLVPIDPANRKTAAARISWHRPQSVPLVIGRLVYMVGNASILIYYPVQIGPISRCSPTEDDPDSIEPPESPRIVVHIRIFYWASTTTIGRGTTTDLG